MIFGRVIFLNILTMVLNSTVGILEVDKTLLKENVKQFVYEMKESYDKQLQLETKKEEKPTYDNDDKVDDKEDEEIETSKLTKIIFNTGAKTHPNATTEACLSVEYVIEFDDISNHENVHSELWVNGELAGAKYGDEGNFLGTWSFVYWTPLEDIAVTDGQMVKVELKTEKFGHYRKDYVIGSGVVEYNF